MRFISDSPGFVFQARPQRQNSLGDGSIEITQEPIYCTFQPVHSGAMIYENELNTALRHFAFRGNTQLQDEATPSDPINRLSVYDTDEQAETLGWDETTKAFVEGRLSQLALENAGELLQITDTPIAPPFPTYDAWDGPDVGMLMVKLVEDGFDLNLVLHYERTFGKKRERVIAALEKSIELQQEYVVQA